MNPRAIVDALLEREGETFAHRVDIRLTDTPSPLFRLLVLCVVASKPISADFAVAAAHELNNAGYRTPQAMLESSWQQRVDALGRARYKRFDESTATRLGEVSQFVIDRYHGDLRGLAAAAGRDIDTATTLLREIPGIGPTGAGIFIREVQTVWSWIQPYVDKKSADAAEVLGLPREAAQLAELVGSHDLAALTAALLRSSFDRGLREEILHG